MKKWFTIIAITITTVSLVCSGILAHYIYEEYNETAKWRDSSSLYRIHEVPPSLAQNYISSDEFELFELLADINVALNEIREAGEIKDEVHNYYWNLHRLAEEKINENELHEIPSVKKIFNDYDLYLKSDLFIKRAYDDMNTENLKIYIKSFSDRLQKQEVPFERLLLEQLHQIAKDYRTVDEFSKRAVSELGEVEGNILRVNVKVDKNLTDKLLNEIKDKDLTRFAHVRNLVSTLGSESWDEILKHNSSSKSYYSWKESERILEALVHTDYISISSFETLKDVLTYNPHFELQERENFTIKEESSVVSVYYGNQRLNEGLYVKRGTELNFDILYEYIENEPEEDIEETPDIEDDKPEDNDTEDNEDNSNDNEDNSDNNEDNDNNDNNEENDNDEDDEDNSNENEGDENDEGENEGNDNNENNAN